MLTKRIANNLKPLLAKSRRDGERWAPNSLTGRHGGKSTATITSRPLSTHVNKSWVPTESDLLQKVTTQALVHEISLSQMENSSIAVPWFPKHMPVSLTRWLSLSVLFPLASIRMFF